MWDECAVRVAKDFPEVKWDKMLVDAMTVRMVRKPESLDVIVCTNLVGPLSYEMFGWDRIVKLMWDSMGIYCRISLRRWLDLLGLLRLQTYVPYLVHTRSMGFSPTEVYQDLPSPSTNRVMAQ